MRTSNSNAIAILVVDDELPVRMALRAELEDAAMTVIEVRKATEALWELETNMSIEAVLSDIRMPGDLMEPPWQGSWNVDGRLLEFC